MPAIEQPSIALLNKCQYNGRVTTTSASRRRLAPGERRAQLLDLGVRLLSRRPLEEISIDLLAQTAGISRGLLYHYFGDKLGFREAVVRRAAEDMVAQTAPPAEGSAVERLLVSLEAYVDWVDANYEGYLSLVRGAASDPALREVYEDARNALTERILREDDSGLVPDSELTPLLVRGWQAMVEEMVLAWKAGETPATKQELLDLLVGSLPGLLGALQGRPLSD